MIFIPLHALLFSRQIMSYQAYHHSSCTPMNFGSTLSSDQRKKTPVLTNSSSRYFQTIPSGSPIQTSHLDISRPFSPHLSGQVKVTPGRHDKADPQLDPPSEPLSEERATDRRNKIPSLLNNPNFWSVPAQFKDVPFHELPFPYDHLSRGFRPPMEDVYPIESFSYFAIALTKHINVVLRDFDDILPTLSSLPANATWLPCGSH